MFDLDSYDRMGLGDLGIRRLSLNEAGEFIAKCLWLEGGMPEKGEGKITGIPEKNSYSIYDPALSEPLQEYSQKYIKLLVAAVDKGTLKTEAIQRNIDETIVEKSTFINIDDMVAWLEMRGIGCGDFFEEYFDFENDLYSRAFDFIQAERIRKLNKKLGTDAGEPHVFNQDEHMILYQKCRILEEENKALKGNSENTKPISEKQRGAYLNIIAALLGLLLGKSSSGKPYSQFSTQQAVIDAMHGTYGEKNGLSKRNLEEKFSLAKRNLDGTLTE